MAACMTIRPQKASDNQFIKLHSKLLPHVKAEADYIAPSNDDDGVAAAIREFLRLST